jgi:hypothetical protein
MPRLDVVRGTRFIVRETFGNEAPIEFEADTLDEATAIIRKRQTTLKEMIDDISPKTRAAVENARETCTKAGNA